MPNKLFLTFLFSIFLIVNSFAQRSYDRIIMNDSTVENGIVKGMQGPIIQYNTYNIETKKEGAMHLISIADIARVEYADGRVVKAAELFTSISNIPQNPSSKNDKKANKPQTNIVAPKTPSPIPAPATKPLVTPEDYVPCFIIKTDLVNDAVGFINIGVEKSFRKSITIEGFLGYAGQNKTGSYYFYEDNNYYEFDANLKSGGLFSMAAIKWYPCMSSRRMDYFFHSDGINAAPHGWNLALREKFTLMGTKSTMTYTNTNQKAQSSGGLVLATGTTLDLGYQQSHIFRILSFEIFGGLGYLYRNSAAVNVVSPSGNTLPIIPRYNKVGLATSWGFTVGVDINAFK